MYVVLKAPAPIREFISGFSMSRTALFKSKADKEAILILCTSVMPSLEPVPESNIYELVLIGPR